MTENPLDFNKTFFDPPSDEKIFHYLRKVEEIVRAVIRAKKGVTDWTEEEIKQALNGATGRWFRVGDGIRETFFENARKSLPERPAFHQVTTILQHGIGPLTVDMLIVWSYPHLRLRPKEGTEWDTPTEDPSGWEWKIEEGSEDSFALLLNTPLLEATREDTLGTALRKLTTFRFQLMLLKSTGGFPLPEHLYVLCEKDYAKAVSQATFGALVEEDFFKENPPLFTAIPPLTP